jgi:hypothetical protein
MLFINIVASWCADGLKISNLYDDYLCYKSKSTTGSFRLGLWKDDEVIGRKVCMTKD